MNKQRNNEAPQLSLRKIIVLACVSGVGVSGVGTGLMALGGWGPCGPESALATVGACLNMVHVAWLLALFPRLDSLAGRWHADWVLVVVWPAIVWAILIFIILICWTRLHKCSGPN